MKNLNSALHSVKHLNGVCAAVIYPCNIGNEVEQPGVCFVNEQIHHTFFHIVKLIELKSVVMLLLLLLMLVFLTETVRMSVSHSYLLK